MKKLLTLMLFISCFTYCSGQKVKCDSGYSYMPTIGTSSLIIHADTCLPDSIYKKLWKKFGENMCGEMGLLIISGETENRLMYSRQGTWNDSLDTCIWKEEWLQVRKGEWVDISKKEYDKINKKK